VDLVATMRLDNTLKVFDLLVNTLIVNVNQDTASTNNGVYANVSIVGFALKKKEIAALKLAQARGCNISLALRNTTKGLDADSTYDIDKVIKLLENEKNPVVVQVGQDEAKTGTKTEVKSSESPKAVETPKTPDVGFAPPPTIKMVQVLVAKRFIEPNTLITNDLLKDDFEWKELPADAATDAVSDFTEALNKAFKTGVAKGQWVTREMVGLQGLKPAPQDPFLAPKPGETNPTTEPVKPSVAKPVVARKIVDVAVHTASGTVIHRYEEVEGKLKKIAEMTPEQAAKEDKAHAKPQDAPKVPSAKLD